MATYKSCSRSRPLLCLLCLVCCIGCALLADESDPITYKNASNGFWLVAECAAPYRRWWRLCGGFLPCFPFGSLFIKYRLVAAAGLHHALIGIKLKPFNDLAAEATDAPRLSPRSTFRPYLDVVGHPPGRFPRFLGFGGRQPRAFAPNVLAHVGCLGFALEHSLIPLLDPQRRGGRSNTGLHGMSKTAA